MARVQRVDYEATPLAEPVVLPNGFLLLEGFPSRAGVFLYYNPDGSERREFRPPEEVSRADSLKSLEHRPLTDDHPREGAVTPENVGKYGRGVVLEGVSFDPSTNLMRMRALATHKDLIQKLMTKDKGELSCGYEADVVEEAGVWNGEPYTHVQRRIDYNHLAVVQRGRAGDQCRLRLDTAGNVLPLDTGSAPPSNVSVPPLPTQPAKRAEKQDMAQKMYIGGVEMEVDDTLAKQIMVERTAFETQRAALEKKIADMIANSAVQTGQASAELADAKRAMSAAETEKQTMSAQLADARTKMDAMQVKVTMLETQRADAMDETKIAERVSVRAKLQADATRLMPTDYTCEKKTDHALRVDMLDTIARNNPALKAQVDARRNDAASIATMYDVVLPFALQGSEAHEQGIPTPGVPDSSASLQAKYEEQARNAYKLAKVKA